MEEQWKDIEGYEGIYQVSNLGQVRSLDRSFVTKAGFEQTTKGCIMQPFVTRQGYLSVRLRTQTTRKTFFVHRLVAQAFIENPDQLPYVNHKDEDKQNNRADNLEWCTQEYNVNYGNAITKLSAAHRNHPRLSYEVEQVSIEGEVIAIFPSASEAARAVGAHSSQITRCCRDSSKTAKGYRWRYKSKS